MNKIRVIPCLDVKGPNVVKGICMEGLRVVGKPDQMSINYFMSGADEIIILDIVASLYSRNQALSLVSAAAGEISVPLCVGGGVRNIDDFQGLLRGGADKVAINTQAIRTPEIITQAAQRFGAQCVVVAIQAKRLPGGGWEAHVENGRERTHRDVVDWARQAEAMGAGELWITSVDRDGTCRGPDLDLIRAVTGAVTVPVIAGGGVGSVEDIAKMAAISGVRAVAIGHTLHFGRLTIPAIKAGLRERGVGTRPVMECKA